MVLFRLTATEEGEEGGVVDRRKGTKTKKEERQGGVKLFQTVGARNWDVGTCGVAGREKRRSGGIVKGV